MHLILEFQIYEATAGGSTGKNKQINSYSHIFQDPSLSN